MILTKISMFCGGDFYWVVSLVSLGDGVFADSSLSIAKKTVSYLSTYGQQLFFDHIILHEMLRAIVLFFKLDIWLQGKEYSKKLFFEFTEVAGKCDKMVEK